MKNSTFKRFLSALMALSMVMSMMTLPAAAEDTVPEATEASGHTCSYTVESIVTNATCGVAGEKKLSCSVEGCENFITEAINATGDHTYDEGTVTLEATCGAEGKKLFTCTVCNGTSEEAIDATGNHTYNNGVCTVCNTPKPCTLAADCDANTHVEECLTQCDSTVNCDNKAHKEGCLSQVPCTCVSLCAETKACPVCEGEGQCKGGEAAERIAAVQALIDALPTHFTAEQRQAVADQYEACTDAIAALTDVERSELDLTQYYAVDQATEDPSNVSNQEELRAALAAKAKVINIIGDITVTGKSDADILLINSGVTINGNDKTITSSAPRIVNVETTDAVSINNLNLIGDATVSTQRGINIINVACKLSLNAVNVSGISHYAVHVATSAVGAGSISIQNCSLTGYSALSVYPENYKTTIANSALTGTNPFRYDPYNAYAAIVVSSNNTVSVTGGSITASTTNGNHQAIVTTSGSGSTFDISNSTTLSLQGEQAYYVHDGAYGGNTIKMPSANATVLAQDNLKLVDGKIVPIINHEAALKAAVAAGGTVKLEGDISLTETLEVPSGKTVILDLNGKTISQTKDQSDTYAMILNKGTLTIQDSGTGGKISYADSHNYTSYINYASNTIRNEGTLYIKGGTVENVSNATVADKGYPHAIDCYAGSQLYVEGGTVSCSSYTAIRTFCTSSGNIAMTISGNADIVGNIDFHNVNGEANKGTLTITGGTMDRIRLLAFGSDFSNMTASISGGTIENVTCSNFVDSEADKAEKSIQYLKQVFTIIGGTFKSGETVTDVTALLAPGYKQDRDGSVSIVPVETAKPTVTVDPSVSQTVSDKIIGNEATANVDTGLDQIFSATDTQDAVDILQTANNASGNPADLSNTTIQTTVSVQLSTVENKENSSDVKTLSFEVKPQIQALNADGDVVASATISNEALNGKSITFRLPIVGTTAGKYVTVTHNGNAMGVYPVQGTGDDLYVEIVTKSFSTFTVTILDASAKPIAEATIGEDNITFASIDEAIAYIGTNSGKLKLLENVSTGVTLTVASGKTVTVDLNGKEYTYTGSGSAFVNNGTALTMENGTVKATGTGTLVQNTSGALTITGITYTGTSTSGYTISATGGTATIASGSFTGNAYSVYASDSGAVTINGGTFNKGIAASASANSTKNVTINGGTFQAETNAFNDDVNGESATSGIIYIPGTVSNSLNPAQFKVNPPTAMIEANYEAVLSNGMYKIQKKASFSVGGTENHYGANDSLDTIFTNNKGITVFNIVTNKELKNEHKEFSAEKLEINFNGNLIYGGGSITAASGKSIFLNDIGPNRIDVVLGPGDKAVFGTDGSVTITAAENKNVNGQGVGYGEVLLTVQNTSNNDVGIMYFLGRQATLTVNANGTLATTGQVITGAITATKPIFTITQVDNGTSITSSFVYGSNKTLTFSCNAFFEGLVKVSVDDKDLATTAYTAKAGSTIVTLNNTYLKTLTKGTHKLTMHFLDGQTAYANFYVVSAHKPCWNPQTGDMIMTSVIVMAVAAAGLTALWFIGKKKKK